MSAVAGIDVSSRAIDVVLLDEDTGAGEWHRFELAGETAFERARSVHYLRYASIPWDDVYVAGIEQTYSGAYSAATALALVRGAVGAILRPGLTIIETRPNEWQSIFLGSEAGPVYAPLFKLPRKSADRKTLIKARAIALGFGDAPDLPQDAYDAYGIAWAVRDLNRRAIEEAA